MRLHFLLLSAFVLLSSSLSASPPKLADPLKSLVEAERGFARMSVERGRQEAFLANLADDAILFRPRAVSGRQWMIDHPAGAGILTWEPTFAAVSADGGLGYTTGPWEFRRGGLEEKPVAFGYFMSIWKRQADGRWKVVLDQGNTTPSAEKATTWMPPSTRARPPAADIKREEVLEAVLQADRAFSSTSLERGTLQAYAAYLTGDARLYRPDAFPYVGKKAALAAVEKAGRVSSWQPDRGDVSAAGDLAYTYGTAEERAAAAAKGEPAVYVRLWRREKDVWRVALEVLVPLPPVEPERP
jgi:ketosteroid isomerase-like protein